MTYRKAVTSPDVPRSMLRDIEKLLATHSPPVPDTHLKNAKRQSY